MNFSFEILRVDCIATVLSLSFGTPKNNQFSICSKWKIDYFICPKIWIPPNLGWLVGCFGFNGPLRQYFSLYPAVSQREGEREEKG